MSRISLKPFSSRCHVLVECPFRPRPSCRFIAHLFSVTAPSVIDLGGTEQIKPMCLSLLTGVECLAASPIRLHTLVVSCLLSVVSFRFGSFRFVSVRFDSVQFGSVVFCSVLFFFVYLCLCVWLCVCLCVGVLVVVVGCLFGCLFCCSLFVCLFVLGRLLVVCWSFGWFCFYFLLSRERGKLKASTARADRKKQTAVGFMPGLPCSPVSQVPAEGMGVALSVRRCMLTLSKAPVRCPLAPVLRRPWSRSAVSPPPAHLQ